MTIVCNTSPITNLAAITQLELLHSIFGEIVIPQAVYDELTNVGYPVPGTVEVQTVSWVKVMRVQNRAQVASFQQRVDAGEAEAIVLALELSAKRLLIDEAIGRSIAEEAGLKVTGILGVLLIAKQQDLISLVQPLIDSLIERAGFRVSSGLYQAILSAAQE
ncbi:DUF3368 domain-containing protein [Leptolyngbya sp. FACHB-17]|uniref:DUF3368 domain-containing protein n=1 Tax=unclassified Leptolyngbya TaxID=2650499 RepID=UPI001680A2CB|nr:DUF3368 domain-containing protein [Leptolyngbya sp. FACHB-17]